MNGDAVCMLGVSGFKKSGKTTLIEGLLGVLLAKGLRVAVIKHQHEPVNIDEGGGDTCRAYQAGADVLGYDGRCVFTKAHAEGAFALDKAQQYLSGRYDLILVEGFKSSDIAKLWLLRQGEDQPPGGVTNIVRVLKWSDDRLSEALSAIKEWFEESLHKELPL